MGSLVKLSEEKQAAYDRLCMKVDMDIDIGSVILSDENMAKVRSLLNEMENRQEFQKIGIEPMNKVIMYGASGTGKTYLAKALANKLGLTMLYINIANALTVGNAAKALVEIFDIAGLVGDALVFLDECDSICWRRDDRENSDDAAIRRANNTLFQLMDQMPQDILFMGATNLYENLDPAFVRRFNISMKFLSPAIDDVSDVACRMVNKEYFTFARDMDCRVKGMVDHHAVSNAMLSYARIKDWVEQVEKELCLKKEKCVRESAVYRKLMQDMRIELKQDEKGRYYLHKYPVDKTGGG